MPNQEKGNIDKLSLLDKAKLFASKNSGDVLDFVMKEKNEKEPIREEYSPDEVLDATHSINPEVYKAALNEQSDLLVQGAADINKKVEEFSAQSKENVGKDEIEESTLSVGNIIIDNTHEKIAPNKGNKKEEENNKEDGLEL